MSEKVAIILAAGMSSRMNTKLPKVLHEVCGRPMLAYVIDACRNAGIQKLYIIVGYGKEQVIHYFNSDKDITWVEQKEQKGTGHAVLCCKEHLAGFDGDTLILCGDGPLIRAETLSTLIEKHQREISSATLATAILNEPMGYGRIIRDSYGNIQGIVEEADCTPEQKSIKEVNPSYYCFKNKVLFEALSKITPNNVKNEYYLTDALRLIIEAGHKVLAVTAVAAQDAMGVNSRQQLSEAGKIMQRRIQDRLMKAGVTIVDPPNTWIDARAQIGQDTVVEPFTYIHGRVKIGVGCRIGPFAYVREGTVIGNDVVLGVFTEVKNSQLSDGVRARHLSYIGDSELGKNADIGAGAITANFDGKSIQRTKIGDGVFVGPGSVLIAPIEVPARMQIAPGSAVSSENIKQ
ncbi:MAG: Bifunctional protein GlmU [Planctomycetes bacterium ADurb.Bin401]|jgi:bifunctional UDP-N-acetylglucosamine pyrophosphorylase/glucosamine-1-phosphate N-acetyltransferase|nr:MAG: Bifunctional protein GlmU [Planctomycetes bacterium ADurb.Bin401]